MYRYLPAGGLSCYAYAIGAGGLGVQLILFLNYCVLFLEMLVYFQVNVQLLCRLRYEDKQFPRQYF